MTCAKGRDPGLIQDQGLRWKLGGGEAWGGRNGRLSWDVRSEGGALRCANRGVSWAAGHGGLEVKAGGANLGVSSLSV